MFYSTQIIRPSYLNGWPSPCHCLAQKQAEVNSKWPPLFTQINMMCMSIKLWLFSRQALRQSCSVKVLTIFVDGEGHIRGDNLVVADLAKLERAVSVHSFHLQDAVILLPLDHGGFVGLLFKHWWILIEVVHLDVDSGPDGDKFKLGCFVSRECLNSDKESYHSKVIND